MKNRLYKNILIVLILLIILIVVSVISLCIGSTSIPLKRIFFVLFQTKDSTDFKILFSIRLPRILLGFAIGGALSLSGVILQGIFKNPLVEPYTLGISGGAGLGVCLNIVFKMNNIFGIISYPLFGFFGASSVILLIYFLSIKRGLIKINEMLLTGVMISFICSSIIMFIMAVSKAEDIHGIVFWIMGSLDEPNWELIIIAVITSLTGLAISYFFSNTLNALSLGDEEAIHLGINVELNKRILFILTSFLTGISVSIGGIIGFVGLIVPLFVRMFVGYDFRIILITSFLSGASFLIICDTISRTIISPLELPVGVVTGIIGGVLFVYALSKRQIKL